MKARTLGTALLLVLALPALAQETKKPTIEPMDFKDPGPVGYKFVKGKTETYTTESTAKSVVGVQVMGQDMTITTQSTMKTRTSITPLEDGAPVKVEVVTDRAKGKTKVDNPMMPVDVTIDDNKIKVTSGDQVLYDSESGEENPMAAQFAQGTGYIGKKATFTLDANGRAGEKMEGDKDAVRMFQSAAAQGIFPIVWKGQEGLKVGDTWEIESELKVMERMELKKPLKIKATYKVLGMAKVDGVPCVEIEVAVNGKATDLEAQMEQMGQQMNLTIPSATFRYTGKAYYDPAQNRPIYAEMKGVVEMEAKGDIPGAGSMDLKVSVDSSSVTRHNQPW